MPFKQGGKKVLVRVILKVRRHSFAEEIARDGTITKISQIRVLCHKKLYNLALNTSIECEDVIGVAVPIICHVNRTLNF